MEKVLGKVKHGPNKKLRNERFYEVEKMSLKC